MNQTTEVKKRFKMYKAGKHWVIAPIVFLGIIGGIGLVTDSAQAAEVDAQPVTEASQPPSVEQQSDAVQQKDTASQPSTAEAAPQTNSTENSVATENNSTNSQEKVEAPATGEATVSTTDPDKVNVPATPVEIATPEQDKAVTEASKDPNVTITGEKENLGALTPEEVAQKKEEIDQEQKENAKKIEQQLKELQDANKKIEEENAKKKEEYDKQLAEHEKTKAEAEKNKDKDGYLNKEQEKYLLFDKTSVKDAKLVSVKADKYIDAKKFFQKYPLKPNAQQTHLFERLANESGAFYTTNSNSGKSGEYNGGWMALLQNGKAVVVTYENLNGSYNGKKIVKAEYTYVLKQSPNGWVNAFFHNDPTITITYGLPTGKNQASNVEIELVVKFFDANGKEILPEKDKPFLYSGASLNSRGEGNSYEYMTLGNGGKFLKINGSKVDQHGNKIYSATDIDTGTQGIDTSQWDGGATGKEYIGAGVVSTGERIKFTFGHNIKKNPGFQGNSMWFAFNTDLKTFTVTPKPPELKYNKPKKENIHYKKYEMFQLYTPKPDKTVINAQKVDINDKNVLQGDRIDYDMTWDLKGYGEHFQVESDDIVKGVSFKDDYDETFLNPKKDLFMVTDANGNNILDQVDITWDDVNGVVTVTAKDPLAFIKAHGGTELKVFFATKAKANVTGDIINTAVQNTFGQELETAPIITHIPKINPVKDVVITVGDKQSINHSEMAFGSIFNYQLNSSVRPSNFGGVTEEWSIRDVLSLKDQATGQNLVLAARDFVLADGTVIKAGTDISNYFYVQLTTDEDGRQVVTFKATQEFLDIMNLEANKATEQGWTAYIQVKRVGYGDVENTFEESYNGEIIQSNTVMTHTPKEPVIPEEPATPIVQATQAKPIAVKIPEVKPVPEKIVQASVLPQLPKTGEDTSKGILLSAIGGILAMIGLAGAGIKRKATSNKK